MNKLEELLTYKALEYKLNSGPGEEAIADAMEGKPGFETKNVCAKLEIDLVVELEQVCSLLNMSKRTFIKAAIVEALSKFDEIATRHDMLEGDYVAKENSQELKKVSS